MLHPLKHHEANRKFPPKMLSEFKLLHSWAAAEQYCPWIVNLNAGIFCFGCLVSFCAFPSMSPIMMVFYCYYIKQSFFVTSVM